jgi:transcription antitermination factor NusA-like protein
MLCPKCEEKVRTGEITELDIKIAKLLLELEEKFPVLQDIYLHHAVETGNIITLLVDRGDVSRILSQGGKILRAIGDKTGRKVRILEHKGDLRKFLEDIFAPASIVTINTIWLPDGSTETRVILSERDLKRLPASFETLKELARKIRGVTLRIESETARAR